MPKRRILFPLSLLAVAVLLVLGITLQHPTRAQAGPLAGFTPTPTSPDGDGDNSDGRTTTEPDADDKEPVDFVTVQIDQCNPTMCLANTPLLDDISKFEPIAAIDDGTPYLPLLVPKAQQVPHLELLAQVHLVHPDTGWITEGSLSNQRSTRFTVPYPGQWEVYLVAPPQIVPADLMTNEGLSQALAESFSGTPQLMGIVEANAPGTQLVRCPVNCVVEGPPPAAPDLLPTTGSEKPADMSQATALLIGGLSLTIVGLTFLLVMRLDKPEQG